MYHVKPVATSNSTASSFGGMLSFFLHHFNESQSVSSVADPEIFEGGFSLQKKTVALSMLKPKKKGLRNVEATFVALNISLSALSNLLNRTVTK